MRVEADVEMVMFGRRKHIGGHPTRSYLLKTSLFSHFAVNDSEISVNVS